MDSDGEGALNFLRAVIKAKITAIVKANLNPG